MAEFELLLASEVATGKLAAELASILGAGDVIGLAGDLGAGKTSFARALIRSYAMNDWLEVPSPTFTLLQTYDFEDLAIAHFDLYRLGDPEDLDEIGFDAAIRSGAALVEWPDRAGGVMPSDALLLCFEPGPDVGARLVRIVAPDGWEMRIKAVLARLEPWTSGS